ncbi:hypothetical protein FL583_17820 [Cryptosporangium phraense]|uniref:Uncharacterized protein n=1 Tax=Cryptosporangium phraense TaxID=2593070 RepID=A0A545ARD4_9ACTN|nr:hypothetical protein FL583_17820 [Cryptosporangium phraense]
MAHLEETWDARIAAPAADLAIVGTLKWLKADLAALLSNPDEHAAGQPRVPGTIADILLPDEPGAATWSTRLYSSARFAEVSSLPGDLRAVVLDGAPAVKYLNEIETPVVVCVIDRSVADETAAEIVVQLRNTRGEALSVRDDLGWSTPDGVEALTFTVPL